MQRQDELITFLGFSLSPTSLHHVETYTKMVASAQRSILQFAAAVASVQLTRYFGSQMNAMKNAAATTGVSTEKLQEWQYVAAKTGVATNTITADFKKLTQTMASPIPGQFNKNLAMMGVSVYKAKGGLKTADELFGSIADRMSKMSAQRAMQWGKLIGISPDTVLLLRQGREALEAYRAEAKASIISSESIDALARFHREINTLALITRRWSIEFMSAFTEPFIRVVKNVKDWFRYNEAFLKGAQLSAVKQLTWAYDDLSTILTKLIGVMGFLGPTMQKTGKLISDSLDEGGFHDLVMMFTLFTGGKIAGRLGGKLFGGMIAKRSAALKAVNAYAAAGGGAAAAGLGLMKPTAAMMKQAAWMQRFSAAGTLVRGGMLAGVGLAAGAKFIGVILAAAAALDVLETLFTDNDTLLRRFIKNLDDTNPVVVYFKKVAEDAQWAVGKLSEGFNWLIEVLDPIIPSLETMKKAVDMASSAIKSITDLIKNSWLGRKTDTQGNVTPGIGESIYKKVRTGTLIPEDWPILRLLNPFIAGTTSSPLWLMFSHGVDALEGAGHYFAKTGRELAAEQYAQIPPGLMTALQPNTDMPLGQRVVEITNNINVYGNMDQETLEHLNDALAQLHNSDQ